MTQAVRDDLAVEQFLKLPELKPALELIRGRVVQKVSPKRSHSVIQSMLWLEVQDYAKRRRLGRSFIELRCTFGGDSLVPDVCFIARDRIPKDEHGLFAEDVNLAPDLAVEILSPGQTLKELSSKLTRALAHGVRLGWLVHPRKKQVTIYKPGLPIKVLRSGEILMGDDVLPGFALPLDTMFGWVMEE